MHDVPRVVEDRDPARAPVVGTMPLERRNHLAVREPDEAVKKAQVRDAIEPPHDGGMERIVEIEQQIAVGRESVGEQHPARSELVFGVMGPESLFADRRRRHDGAVAISIALQIDDRQEVAILSVLVAAPAKEVAGWRLFTATGGRWQATRTTECS